MTHPRSLCLALLMLAGAHALAGPAPAAVDTASPVMPASALPAQRLPSLHLHGPALVGREQDVSVDEIDRLALLTTWKILDPYKRRANTYTGIRLKDLVDTLAPKATRVRMRAINDYITVFERSEWESLPILLATRDGDSRMDVAHKGPARIVYLQTQENEMAMQVHAPKWIWQVIDVEFQSR